MLLFFSNFKFVRVLVLIWLALWMFFLFLLTSAMPPSCCSFPCSRLVTYCAKGLLNPFLRADIKMQISRMNKPFCSLVRMLLEMAMTIILGLGLLLLKTNRLCYLQWASRGSFTRHAIFFQANPVPCSEWRSFKTLHLVHALFLRDFYSFLTQKWLNRIGVQIMRSPALFELGLEGSTYIEVFLWNGTRGGETQSWMSSLKLPRHSQVCCCHTALIRWITSEPYPSFPYTLWSCHCLSSPFSSFIHHFCILAI